MTYFDTGGHLYHIKSVEFKHFEGIILFKFTKKKSYHVSSNTDLSTRELEKRVRYLMFNSRTFGIINEKMIKHPNFWNPYADIAQDGSII